MSFGSVPGINTEVFNPSFEAHTEALQERKMLSEQVRRIDTVESLEQSFSRIEEVSKYNIDEAKVMAKSFLLKSEYFAKVGGIDPIMLNFITEEASRLFENYFASLEAANKKMEEKLTFESEINQEIQAAQTPEEFKDLQSVKKTKINQIMQSYQRMSSLYHLAEQKIESIFAEYFPRKNNLAT